MICPVGSPRVVGGAERLWNGTVAAINELTAHRAEVVEIASPERSLRELVASYERFDRADLAEFDLVISGKYPAWMVRHPRHVVYMCHTLRGLYDTYPAGLPIEPQPESRAGVELDGLLRLLAPAVPGHRESVLEGANELVGSLEDGHPDLAFPGPLARRLVHWLDADALHPTRMSAHLAISRTVARRRDYFPVGIDVRVVTPPSSLRTGPSTGFGALFTASRLDGPKRIDLLIDAMREVAVPVNLRIAGTGPLDSALRERASGDARIQFLGGLTDDDLAAEYASALAVPFVPLDEDLGLITLEAQMSGKPVITCTDSGGSLDLVTDGVDGFVVEPRAAALAAAISAVARDRELAAAMGDRGRVRAAAITWDRVVEELLAGPASSAVSPPSPTASSTTSRPTIVALSTYPAVPARHGGQVRVNRLLSAVAEDFDVHLICLPGSGARSGQVAAGFRQTVIDASTEYHQLEELLRPLGVPTGDIAAALAYDDMSALRAEIALALRDAAAVILPHPYLFPAVRSLDPQVPVVYDAHNAEWSLKRQMYPAIPAGVALADAVASIESACLRRADLVVAVSDDDLALLDDLAGTMADKLVVPNGADVLTVDFVTGERRRSMRQRYLDELATSGWACGAQHVAVFLGSGHPPNVEAAWEVLRVARELPEVLFVLLGTHVDQLGGLPRGANVLARGVVEPDELALLLASCDVALNPMTAGSGTNIKMLDYFAAGAPVVSSSVGARGLPVSDGVHLVLADDGLAERIAAVLRDPAGADARAEAARRIAAGFDWTTLGRDFAAAVSTLVRRPVTS